MQDGKLSINEGRVDHLWRHGILLKYDALDEMTPAGVGHKGDGEMRPDPSLSPVEDRAGA